MSVAAVSTVASDRIASTASSPASLGQADFLRLLTAQLSEQDPFNPTDNSQMIAQMAQFSQVSGIAEINSSLSRIADMLRSGSSGGVADWIGRSALIETDAIAALPDGRFSGEIDVPEASDTAELRLVDAVGTIIHTRPLGAQPAGSLAFDWQPDAGDAVPTPVGGLRVELAIDGKPVAATVRSWTTIQAVQSPLDAANSRLLTPGGSFAPATVVRLG